MPLWAPQWARCRRPISDVGRHGYVLDHRRERGGEVRDRLRARAGITVAGALDHESVTSYTLTVEASDGRGGSATATVGISITEASCSHLGVNAGLVGDCETLLAIRDTLAGTATLNWSLDTEITSWDGVTVGGTPRRVIKLSISSQGLNGTIPSEIALLSSLEELILWGNQLSGEIPADLGNLTRLTRLTLSTNMLSGEIPSELGMLSNLRSLLISGNQLTGDIPPELGRLSNLQDLWFDRNLLTGSIPSELGDMASLASLLVNSNRLTGDIPPELGRLSNLETIWLQRNQLTGAIPEELGELANLRKLILHGNRLTGAIPWQLESLSNLESLHLSGNRLEGCIPSALRRVESNDLANLNLPDCTREGPAPSPGGLSVSVVDGAFTIAWSAVTGASRYEVEYRTSGSNDDWVSVATTGETSATYSSEGVPACGSAYEFHVRSYGDAATYAAGWGPYSDATTVETASCN